MAYKIQFDNGHTVEFDAQPSDADIDEAYAHTKTLVPKIDQSQERENLRAENVQQFYGDVVDNLTGVGQAAASLASSAVAMPAGFAAGLLQKANDPSGVDFEKQVAANMDRLTYHPSREKGEEYLAPVGKLFNDVGIPALAHLGGTQLPGLKDIQLQRAANKKTPFPKDTRGLPTLEERMTATKTEQLKGQGELFPETLKDTTGHASPYDASVIGTTEPITPLRARRQQELQLSPKETLPIDAEGNIGNIDAGTRAAMEQQRKALERELDSTQPIDNLKATEGPGGQQALFDIPESARMRNPTEAVTGDWRVDENGIPVKADLSMEAANLENGAQRNLWGDELPPKHEQEMANVSPLDRTQKPIGQRGFANKQTGAIQLPFGRKDAAEQIKKIGAFKKGAFFAEERSVPQLIEDLKANPVKDIDQNVAQKISNSLTKGSIYMTDRTNNPVLKVVGDKIRQATNTALSVIREQVHDKLAPAWRDLSREEYTEAGAMMIAAEKAKFDLTPEFLRKEGMNDKQINAIMAQKEVMADMLERTNAGLRALGKKEISGNVSNLASRANGDFRRVIVNKDNQVVGVVGARTRYGLNSQIKKLIAEHPEYKIGDEMYFGGRGKRAMDEGFAQLMDFLNQNDPNVKKFVEDLSGVISKDAFDYMNAKTHTMQKKGVFGMTGRKYGASMEQNVRDMVDAQIQHAETITKWSEISKAVGELKPLLEPRNGIEMPLAKQMARDYIEGALGNGPGAVGRALDDVFSGIGKTTGIGTSIPAHILSTNKKVVNGLLIGFGKLPFIAANMIQPVKNMIGQAAYLRSNGFETGFTMGMGKAMDTILREQFGKKLSALDEGAIQYARDNHVYSSSLFEAGNYSRKGVGYWWDHASQVGANKVEMLTRKMTFLSYVNMLHENGIKVSDGLYKAAQNLTDVHMNNYANAEAPRVFQTLGGVGKSAYNLLSFKHNELSRIAMLAREIGKNGDARPLLWEMASQIAFGGIMGTILYQEANWAIEQITKAMGKPTSLTKILLENSDKLSTVFSRGAPTLAGIDMSTSLGMTVTPEPGLDMLHPGLGKTVDIAKAGYDAVTKPSAYNAANLVREAAPLSVAGLINTQKPFAKEQANGDTMLRNPSTGEGTVTLTPAETFIKRLGFKSVGESTQKGLLFANDKISKVYAEKRGKVIDAALKNYTVYGKLPEGWAQDYVKNQGDPNTAVSEITNKLMAANVDRPTRELLINSMSNSVTSTHKLLRSLKKE